MNNLKKIISERIMEPAVKDRSSNILSGVVISANENSNLCKVKFTDNTGHINTLESVPVFIYNKSIIDWFPKENEEVMLQQKGNQIFITGPTDSDYAMIRNRISLRNDIYAESFFGGIGGYLI